MSNSATFIENLKAEFQSTDPSTLSSIKQSAWNSFETLGFPTVKNEEFKYTNFIPTTKTNFSLQVKSNITAEDLKSIEIIAETSNVLVFVNGAFHKSLSSIVTPNSDAIICTLAEAYNNPTEKANIDEHLAKYTNNTADGFTALSTATANDGVYIRVPANKIVKTPIVLYFIADTRTDDIFAQARNLFLFDQNSQATVVESFHTLGKKASFNNVVSEISIASDAIVDYYKVQNESEKAYHVGTTQVHQKGKSVFNAVTITLNGAIVRNNLNAVLDGEYIESNLFGLFVPSGTTHIDNHTIVDHAKPNCNSKELYKGVLDGKSTGVFNGKIFVRKDAQKTNAFQSNKSILLSDEATINTKPQLEIWADDVKCSHGATSGQLDPESLFYLRSRGLSERSAKALLVYAFASDVISNIKIESLKANLEQKIAEKLAVQ
jgi:Fe-S cluster assembly protein SufD